MTPPPSGASTACTADERSSEVASGATILVVEDDIEVQQALADLFTDVGYTVRLAGNGFEALRSVERFGAPDLVVLDLTMPVMDGHEFLRRRHHVSQLNGVPVVVLSAAVRARQMLDGEEVHRKPIDADELLSIVAGRLA